MRDRDATSFWAVWAPGQEWPSFYASEKMAREAAHRLAKSNIGAQVHLMKVASVGTVEYPSEPRLSGQLVGAPQ